MPCSLLESVWDSLQDPIKHCCCDAALLKCPLSSGLPPLEAPVMIAEKCRLSLSFIFLFFVNMPTGICTRSHKDAETIMMLGLVSYS